MHHGSLSYRITLLLYSIVILLALGFYKVKSTFQTIQEDTNIIYQINQIENLLITLDIHHINYQEDVLKIDNSVNKIENWITGNGDSGLYIGAEPLPETFSKINLCWQHIKHTETNTSTCSVLVGSFSTNIQKTIYLKQNKLINDFYIALTIIIILILLTIYFIRVYIHYQLRKHAIHDHETGLYNKKYFDAQLQSACARSARYSDSLSILRISLNGYTKKTYDKQTNALLLRRLGNILSSVIRSSDIAARHDENKFMILLADTDIEKGTMLEKRIKEALLGYDFNVSPKVEFDLKVAQYHADESSDSFLQRV